MIIFGLAAIFIWLSYSQRSPLHRAAVKEKEGVFLDCDMSAKIRELMDDPAMTTAKWQAWLPVFEAADREVQAKCPNLPLGKNSEFVRKIIDPDYDPVF